MGGTVRGQGGCLWLGGPRNSRSTSGKPQVVVHGLAVCRGRSRGVVLPEGRSAYQTHIWTLVKSKILFLCQFNTHSELTKTRLYHYFVSQN